MNLSNKNSMNPSDYFCNKCDRKAILIKCHGKVILCDYHAWFKYKDTPKPEWYREYCFHECRLITENEPGCNECVAYDNEMKKIQQEILDKT